MALQLTRLWFLFYPCTLGWRVMLNLDIWYCILMVPTVDCRIYFYSTGRTGTPQLCVSAQWDDVIMIQKVFNVVLTYNDWVRFSLTLQNTRILLLIPCLLLPCLPKTMQCWPPNVAHTHSGNSDSLRGWLPKHRYIHRSCLFSYPL